MRKEMAGEKFGRLLVIEFSHIGTGGTAFWKCNCDCGNKEVIISGKNLRSGQTKSCGCIRDELIRAAAYKRGKLSEEHKRNIGLAYRNRSAGIRKPTSIFEVSRRTMCKIITRLGIGCSNCGWDESTGDIHHIQGRKIENADAHTNLSYLCPNCHRLVHTHKIAKENLITLEQQIGDRWKEYYFGYDFKDSSFIKTCLTCNKEFLPKNKTEKYCSHECASQDRIKFKITKEELEKLVWEMPSSHIAKLFGISDTTIVKKCKKYNILKPCRGYWAKIYGEAAEIASCAGL